LGGGQVGANWHTGQWAFGVQGDLSATDLRGENTCFSGLGGTNCQRIVKALGTLTGRVGYAWERSLLYVKGGGAWTNTTYNLDGDMAQNSPPNLPRTLGAGSTTMNAGGWTLGTGLEFAVSDHISAQLEYDHLGIPGVVVAFPTVAMVNTQTVRVRQDIDLVKLGINYRFDSVGALVARN
jgi:opacity protein-like surface antigen